MSVSRWRTGCEAGACVEVVQLPDGLGFGVRAPTQGVNVFFTDDEWDRFTEAVKAGRFDRTTDPRSI